MTSTCGLDFLGVQITCGNKLVRFRVLFGELGSESLAQALASALVSNPTVTQIYKIVQRCGHHST